MEIILCDDILELIGNEVKKIRNIQWWTDNYGYHLSNDKFLLNLKQIRIKDLNSRHTAMISLQFNHYINTNHNFIPQSYKGVLHYTILNFSEEFEYDSYSSIPSKRYMKSNPRYLKIIQDHLEF